MNLDLKIGSIYWVRIARLEKSGDGRTLISEPGDIAAA